MTEGMRSESRVVQKYVGSGVCVLNAISREER